MRIALCSVHVTDPASAFAFYTSTLGFTDLVSVPDARLFIVAAPEAPQGPGLLLEPSDAEVALTYRQALYAAGLPALVLGVDDVRAEYERLADLGVQFLGEPATDPSGTSVLLDDGHGNYLQLHQPAP